MSKGLVELAEFNNSSESDLYSIAQNNGWSSGEISLLNDFDATWDGLVVEQTDSHEYEVTLNGSISQYAPTDIKSNEDFYKWSSTPNDGITIENCGNVSIIRINTNEPNRNFNIKCEPSGKYLDFLSAGDPLSVFSYEVTITT